MGWFGKKKKEVAPVAPSISLKKKVEEHQVSLKKALISLSKKPSVMQARVVLVMDVSGSMQDMFYNGTVQRIIERSLPMGLEFDDDGSVEVFIFSNDCKEICAVTIENIADFVNREVMPKVRWGGTRYATAVNMITQQYGVKNPSNDPTFVIFVTDGDNQDKAEATRAITEAARFNIFWKFVGVGGARMPYLEKLDDMGGRVVDNANFFQVRNIDGMSDEDLYKNLLEEYADWQEVAQAAGILAR